MSYLLFESTRKDKKYMVITPDFKVIHFGQRGADDFTTSKDESKKISYLLKIKIFQLMLMKITNPLIVVPN